MRKTVLLLLATLLVLTGCQGNDAARMTADLQARFDDLREESGFPGGTAAALLADGTLIQVSTGTADYSGEKKMPPDARMFSGSTGKTFVSAVALQLVDEGSLDLDAFISDWFDEEEWFGRLPNGSDITVRMLLNHTGGLPRYVMKPELWADLLQEPDRVWQPLELLEFILGDDPVHPAGRGWHYSDTDYILVGMIIEKITGRTFYDELQSRILDPLGLDDTVPSNKRRFDRLPEGLSGEGPFNLPAKVIVEGKYIFNPQFEWTGGGLVTSSGDLAVWAGNLYRGELFSRERLKELLQPVDLETGAVAGEGYGLGVFVTMTEMGIRYDHGGIFPGYQTIMGYYPDHEIALALQLNADRFSGKLDRQLGDYLSALAEAVAGE